MSHTGWFLRDLDTTLIARPYTYSGGYVDNGLVGGPDYPDAALRTTAPSLARFLMANMNWGELGGTRILDSATVSMMRTVYVPTVPGYPDRQWGLIWWKDNSSGHDLWGHNGGFSGVMTAMFMSEADTTGVIFLSNIDPGLWWKTIVTCLIGEAHAAPLQPAKSWSMYAVSAALCSLNTANGIPATIGSLGPINLGGLAIHPLTGELYGSVTGAATTTLYRVSCADAWTKLAQTFTIGYMQAIAFDKNGELFGASRVGRLYRLNLATGDTAGIGTAPGAGYGSIAFSPSGRLWASVYIGSGTDKIYTIDTSTGQATLAGRTGDNLYTKAIFFNPSGTLYGLKTNSSGTNTIITIDTLTGVGTTLLSLGAAGINSVAMASYTGAVAVEPTAETPRVCALLPNYPNPFNPTTKIQFTIVDRQLTIVNVYDLMGRKVATLVNEVKEPGTYTVQFDGSNLASGVYMYRLTAGIFVQTRKLLLLR
jgi:hypothetical protein